MDTHEKKPPGLPESQRMNLATTFIAVGLAPATELIVVLEVMLGLVVALAIHLDRQVRAWERTAEAATQKLTESDLRFRIVTRATNEAVWDWNLANKAVWWNRNVQTQFGYADDQVGQDHAWWLDHVHPEDRERVAAGLDALLRGDKDFWAAA